MDFYSKLSAEPSEAPDEYFKRSGLYLEKLRLSCAGRRRGGKGKQVCSGGWPRALGGSQGDAWAEGGGRTEPAGQVLGRCEGEERRQSRMDQGRGSVPSGGAAGEDAFQETETCPCEFHPLWEAAEGRRSLSGAVSSREDGSCLQL